MDGLGKRRLLVGIPYCVIYGGVWGVISSYGGEVFGGWGVVVLSTWVGEGIEVLS